MKQGGFAILSPILRAKERYARFVENGLFRKIVYKIVAVESAIKNLIIKLVKKDIFVG